LLVCNWGEGVVEAGEYAVDERVKRLIYQFKKRSRYEQFSKAFWDWIIAIGGYRKSISKNTSCGVLGAVCSDSRGNQKQDSNINSVSARR
jgi:hypothetical protein